MIVFPYVLVKNISSILRLLKLLQNLPYYIFGFFTLTEPTRQIDIDLTKQGPEYLNQDVRE